MQKVLDKFVRKKIFIYKMTQSHFINEIFKMNKGYFMGIQERKEREKRARQEAIMNAARKLFFEKGLDQVTMDDVAERAELSKGTLYLYFKSKEELYISVFLKGLDILTEQFGEVKELFDTCQADELIRKFRDIYYAFFMKYPEYFYINSLFYHGRIKEKIDPAIWASAHQKSKQCLLALSEIIQKGIADGMFRDVDCWKTANSLWAAGTGVMMILDDAEHRKFVDIPIKELLDYTAELLVEGLKINTHK